MSEFDYVILGGGIAGGHAACEMADRVGRGEACLITAENRPPYHRPALSKAVLRGETESLSELLIRDRAFYRRKGIELKLDTPVSEVDLEARELVADGERVRFERLLIATGARPRRLQLPGGQLEGVHYLRTSRDAASILATGDGSDRAVVFGGGVLGFEVAASLAESGGSVSLVFSQRRILQNSPFTPEMSDFFEACFRRRGVEILSEERLTSLNGYDGVTSVSTASGKSLAAEIVVIGVGVVPNTSLFSGTKLEIDDGLVVDSGLETNVEGIFAAGDVARFPDGIFDTDRRIEHWDNARRQGRHAARSMLGDKQRYRYVPYFSSSAFDLSWEFWGDRSGADQVVYRGSIANGSFSAWWLRRRGIVAAFVMDRPPEEREWAPRMIESGRLVDPLRMSDDAIPLAGLVSDVRAGSGA